MILPNNIELQINENVPNIHSEFEDYMEYCRLIGEPLQEDICTVKEDDEVVLVSYSELNIKPNTFK